METMHTVVSHAVSGHILQLYGSENLFQTFIIKRKLVKFQTFILKINLKLVKFFLDLKIKLVKFQIFCIKLKLVNF